MIKQLIINNAEDFDYEAYYVDLANSRLPGSSQVKALTEDYDKVISEQIGFYIEGGFSQKAISYISRLRYFDRSNDLTSKLYHALSNDDYRNARLTDIPNYNNEEPILIDENLFMMYYCYFTQFKITSGMDAPKYQSVVLRFTTPATLDVAIYDLSLARQYVHPVVYSAILTSLEKIVPYDEFITITDGLPIIDYARDLADFNESSSTGIGQAMTIAIVLCDVKLSSKEMKVIRQNLSAAAHILMYTQTQKVNHKKLHELLKINKLYTPRVKEFLH